MSEDVREGAQRRAARTAEVVRPQALAIEDEGVLRTQWRDGPVRLQLLARRLPAEVAASAGASAGSVGRERLASERREP